MEEKSKTIKEEKIIIKGMHCKSCVNSIENELEKLDGVEKAKVDFIEEEGFVRFDSQKTNIGAIKQKIEEMGYKVGDKTNSKETDSENSKNTVKIKFKKPNFLTILVSMTLILTLLNFYSIRNLKKEINSSTGSTLSESSTAGTIETGAGGLREIPSEQPSQQGTIFPQQAQQPQITEVGLGSYPVLGSVDAPVTVVEFSCFECPFCARFNNETLPLIKENYIDTGEVKWVFRDFPLSFHPNAQKAHEAARCADEQGKFWEYHTKLFDSQIPLSVNTFKQYAGELGLNITEFNECLDSGRTAQEVQGDFTDGSGYGVSGTPTFFINGIRLVGAQPYQSFEEIIEQELNKPR